MNARDSQHLGGRSLPTTETFSSVCDGGPGRIKAVPVCPLSGRGPASQVESGVGLVDSSYPADLSRVSLNSAN